MTATAELTVAIATLDRLSGLGRCLDALLGGALLPAEILVIDQGRQVAHEVVDERRARNVALVYVQQERRGLSASRNAAIALASQPLLAVTDDDCVPDRDWLAAIARVLAAPAGPEAVTGRVLPLGPPVPGFYPASMRLATSRREFRAPALPWLAGTGGNFAARRDWLERLDGYDERLGAGTTGRAAEDVDLLYRLLRAGARICYEPDAVVYHERKARTELLSSARGYGFGLGAFCGLWLRRGERYAWTMLAHWLLDHAWALAGDIRRGRPTSAREESLVLLGTVRGLVHGLRSGPGGPG